MEKFRTLTTPERIAATREAIARRTPLMLRWAEVDESWDMWNRRAGMAAEWLRDVRSVVDFGCGSMNLRRHLGASQEYIPVDLVARDEFTVVLNVETDDFSMLKADACAVLGLMEYLYEPRAFLSKIARQFARVVLSYNYFIDRTVERRLSHGWVNNFTADELGAMLASCGLVVSEQREVRDDGHTLLLIHSAGADA